MVKAATKGMILMTDLFGFQPEEVTHQNDPLTSLQAAHKARANAKGLNLAIIQELSKVYPLGLSDEKLAERLNIESSVTGNDVAKRRSTLKKKGVVVEAREKDVNLKGNQVSTWKLRFPPNSKESRWNP